MEQSEERSETQRHWDILSMIVVYLGYLWIGWDEKKQGWHDHIASTHVIRAPGRRGRPASPR